MIALKTLQKLGVLMMIALGFLRMIALKTLQKLGVLTEDTAKTGSFEDDHTENIAKAGIFEEDVRKQCKLFVVGWSTSSLDGSVANRDMGWVQEHLHNFSRLLLRICLRNGLCIIAPKYF